MVSVLSVHVLSGTITLFYAQALPPSPPGVHDQSPSPRSDHETRSHLPERIHSPWRRWLVDETPRSDDALWESLAGNERRFALLTLIEREPLQRKYLTRLWVEAAGIESFCHIENTRVGAGKQADL